MVNSGESGAETGLFPVDEDFKICLVCSGIILVITFICNGREKADTPPIVTPKMDALLWNLINHPLVEFSGKGFAFTGFLYK